MTPLPSPTPVMPDSNTVSIKMVGITISLAGMATIYASKIIPFNPRNIAKGSIQVTRYSARLMPFKSILDTNQISAPAGRANMMALHKTKMVLSINEVYIVNQNRGGR